MQIGNPWDRIGIRNNKILYMHIYSHGDLGVTFITSLLPYYLLTTLSIILLIGVNDIMMLTGEKKLSSDKVDGCR
jgi:hypothetical protein